MPEAGSRVIGYVVGGTCADDRFGGWWHGSSANWMDSRLMEDTVVLGPHLLRTSRTCKVLVGGHGQRHARQGAAVLLQRARYATQAPVQTSAGSSPSFLWKGLQVRRRPLLSSPWLRYRKVENDCRGSPNTTTLPCQACTCVTARAVTMPSVLLPYLVRRAGRVGLCDLQDATTTRYTVCQNCTEGEQLKHPTATVALSSTLGQCYLSDTGTQGATRQRSWHDGDPCASRSYMGHYICEGFMNPRLPSSCNTDWLTNWLTAKTCRTVQQPRCSRPQPRRTNRLGFPLASTTLTPAPRQTPLTGTDTPYEKPPLKD